MNASGLNYPIIKNDSFLLSQTCGKGLFRLKFG